MFLTFIYPFYLYFLLSLIFHLLFNLYPVKLTLIILLLLQLKIKILSVLNTIPSV